MRKQARPRVGRRAGFETTRLVVVQPRSALLIPAVLLVAVLLAVAVLLFLLVLLIPAFLVLPVAVLLLLLALLAGLAALLALLAALLVLLTGLAALLVLLAGLALLVLVVLVTHVGFLSIHPFGLFSLITEREDNRARAGDVPPGTCLGHRQSRTSGDWPHARLEGGREGPQTGESGARTPSDRRPWGMRLAGQHPPACPSLRISVAPL